MEIFLVLFIFSVCILVPAQAAPPISTVPQGGTVFVGEQGLDITSAIGTDSRIGWWASGAAITSSAPDQTVAVPNPTSFFVTPNAFTSYTGNWYRLDASGKADGIAFNVLDPQLAVQVYDTSLSLDRTNDWVPTGDQVRFTINSNLYTISSQRGQGAPVTIYVQAPDGAQYSSVVDAGGISHSMVEIPVTSNPFYTDSAGITWNTGNPLYTQGTYTVWAECNMNHMKDNYLVTGKTISTQITILDQDVNPLIRSGVTTTNPTVIATTPPSTPRPTPIPTTETRIPTPSPTTSTAPFVTTTSMNTIEVTPAATNLPVQTVSSATAAPGFDVMVTTIALLMGIALCKKKI